MKIHPGSYLWIERFDGTCPTCKMPIVFHCFKVVVLADATDLFYVRSLTRRTTCPYCQQVIRIMQVWKDQNPINVTKDFEWIRKK